jgi:hypothetical protein
MKKESWNDLQCIHETCIIQLFSIVLNNRKHIEYMFFFWSNGFMMYHCQSCILC